MKKTFKRRLLSFLLVAILCVQFLPFAVSAVPNTVRIFATSPTTAATPVPQGGSVDITLIIDPTEMPTGFGWSNAVFYLMFDPDIFTPTTVLGPLFMSSEGLVQMMFNTSPPAPYPPNHVAGYTRWRLFMEELSQVDFTVPVNFTFSFDIAANAPSGTSSIMVFAVDAASNAPGGPNFVLPTVAADHAIVHIGTPLVTHTVTFNTNNGVWADGTTTPVTRISNAGTTKGANMPADPTRAGHTFLGWNTAEDGSGTAFTAGTVVNATKTVYAQWIPGPHTLTFNAYPGTIPSVGTTTSLSNITHGTTLGANMPPDPVLYGYTFGGWFTEPGGMGTQVTAEQPINDSWNLQAFWTIDSDGNYVTFNLQGGGPANSFPPQWVAYGATATRPITTPILAGHTFVGWFTAPVGGVVFDFENTPITQPTTVHARWQAAGVGEWPGGNWPGDGGGNQIGGHPDLIISNFPNIRPERQLITPIGPTRTANGRTYQQMPAGTNVTIIAGTADNWTFLGWFRAGNVPAEGATVPVPAGNRHQFVMPGTNRHYVAVWGNQDGVVGIPNTPEEDGHSHYAFLIGFEDGTIRPEGTATRAHLATVLFRLMSDADRASNWTQTNPFADVEIDDWFNNAISTVTNAGILPDAMIGSNFHPERQVTRAEVVATIVRLQGIAPVAGAASFNDITGHWAVRYINAAAREGWALGFNGLGGEFRPNEPVTRAQMAALVNRAFGRLPESPADLLSDMVRWPDNADANAWYYLYIQEASNSHYYEMKADGIHETWTTLIPPRRWEVLERPDSQPGDILN